MCLVAGDVGDVLLLVGLAAQVKKPTTFKTGGIFAGIYRKRQTIIRI